MELKGPIFHANEFRGPFSNEVTIGLHVPFSRHWSYTMPSVVLLKYKHLSDKKHFRGRCSGMSEMFS